jgi:voltage-gated potassium channel
MDETKQRLNEERERMLERVQAGMEGPMVILAFVWLALFVAEAVWGISRLLVWLNWGIWTLFLAEVVLGLALAQDRGAYLKKNWLKVIAVAAPALRIARIATVLRLGRLARASQAVRGMRLLRVISSLNRGMSALGRTMQRRGVGYVVLLTLTVTLVGAAGMYSFEADNGVLTSYGDALWWTAMVMTTMGSEHWPRTSEGRILCLLIAIYAFAVFGYVTATIASFFVGRDAEEDHHRLHLAQTVDLLAKEVRSLREVVDARRP